MKINFKDREKKLFKDIAVGEVFTDSDITAYMKVIETNIGDSEYNAVSLVTGASWYFEDTMPFEVIECELNEI